MAQSLKLNTNVAEIELTEAKDYREFLEVAIKYQFSQQGKPNLSAFSRRAGFASRSFIVELLSRKKRLTQRSLPKTIQALKLKTDLKILFESLVMLEEKDLRPAGLNDADIARKIELLRRRLLSKSNNEANINLIKSDELFSTRAVFPVYAALGSLNKGATLAEIYSRTGVDAMTIINMLNRMIGKGFVRKEKDRFFATDIHFCLESLCENVGFRTIYKQSLEDIAKVVDVKKNDSTYLFLHSSFSVRSENLPALKAKLQHVVQEFIAEESFDDGDCVTNLTVGFYRGST